MLLLFAIVEVQASSSDYLTKVTNDLFTNQHELHSDYDVQIIYSLNSSLSNEVHGDIFEKLRLLWPVTYFTDNVFPDELIVGNHLKCTIHLLLVTTPASDGV